MKSISTFVINLKERTDRKEHILSEFQGKDEFNLTIVTPQQHEKSTVSLWNTIKYIIETLINSDDEFIIICEDDHQFTENYSRNLLLELIDQSDNLNADILSAGVSGLQHFVRINQYLLWMGDFSGLQFTVVFRRFFKVITNAIFKDNDIADLKISRLAENKFVINPFMSVQKEFGYSDVTPMNYNKGRVDSYFDWTISTIKHVTDVSAFYKEQAKTMSPIDMDEYENIFIPTYIINLPERTDRLFHIKEQFADRNEFDVNIIEAVKHEKGNLGLWLTIRKIIEHALIADHDLILICEDDHEFTKYYTKREFIRNLIEAHILGAGVFLGGVCYCGSATLVTNDLFWIDRFYCTQFTIIYKSLFETILNEPYDEKVTADGVLSQITSNKLVTFPFISTQKELGKSDISSTRLKEHKVEEIFMSTDQRLSHLMEATKKYSVST